MPPKTKFTKELLLQIAWQIFETSGLDLLTARAIAEKLKSSTAPVYSCYPSMDELKIDLINKAEQIMTEYCSKPYTEVLDLNMGVGFVRFARDYPIVFQTLFFDKHNFTEEIKNIRLRLTENIKTKPEQLSINLGYIDEFIKRMWIFSMGFAAVINSGVNIDRSDEGITYMESMVGFAIRNGMDNEKNFPPLAIEQYLSQLNPDFHDFAKIKEKFKDNSI